jgi:hypothetical protein
MQCHLELGARQRTLCSSNLWLVNLKLAWSKYTTYFQDRATLVIARSLGHKAKRGAKWLRVLP